jgi:hypothetical protein
VPVDDRLGVHAKVELLVIGVYGRVEEDTFVEQADNPMIVATEIAMKLLFI